MLLDSFGGSNHAPDRVHRSDGIAKYLVDILGDVRHILLGNGEKFKIVHLFNPQLRSNGLQDILGGVANIG